MLFTKNQDFVGIKPIYKILIFNANLHLLHCRPQNLDIKLIQAKHQQAEMRRNRKEEDLRENHPFFDRPLFAVPRESKFRRVCRSLVNARYDAQLKNASTGKERKVSFSCLLLVAILNNVCFLPVVFSS